MIQHYVLPYISTYNKMDASSKDYTVWTMAGKKKLLNFSECCSTTEAPHFLYLDFSPLATTLHHFLHLRGSIAESRIFHLIQPKEQPHRIHFILGHSRRTPGRIFIILLTAALFGDEK